MRERSDVPESVPGPTCLANTLCQLTEFQIGVPVRWNHF